MSVYLSKCKVGDKVQLRNGKIAKIIEAGTCEKYPAVHDGGPYHYHAVTIDGKSCIHDDENDIVKVITPSNNKKVAKCRIYDDFELGLIFSINSFGIHSWPYTTRKNAIRGARRFCKRIGFECEIVD